MNRPGSARRGPPGHGTAALARIATVLRLAPLALALTLCSSLATAQMPPAPQAALPAHVHGVARLDVVVDGPELTLGLSSPLDSLLGFERAPRAEAERDAVRRLAARLRAADGVFVPAPEAGCTLAAVTLASGALAPELLGMPAAAPAAPDHADEPPGHADLDAEWRWTCATPAALRGGEWRLFDAVPRLEHVEVRVVGPRGQSSLRLSRDQRRLRW